jgi:hypothetical protein
MLVYHRCADYVVRTKLAPPLRPSDSTDNSSRLPFTRFRCSGAFNRLGFGIEVLGGAQPRIPDRGTTGSFGKFPIPTGELTEFVGIGLHGRLLA